MGEAPEEVRNCFQQRSRWTKVLSPLCSCCPCAVLQLAVGLLLLSVWSLDSRGIQKVPICCEVYVRARTPPAQLPSCCILSQREAHVHANLVWGSDARKLFSVCQECSRKTAMQGLQHSVREVAGHTVPLKLVCAIAGSLPDHVLQAALPAAAAPPEPVHEAHVLQWCLVLRRGRPDHSHLHPHPRAHRLCWHLPHCGLLVGCR